MNEVYELKKALLATRRDHAYAIIALSELQLKVLEDEHKAVVEEAEIVNGDTGPSPSRG